MQRHKIVAAAFLSVAGILAPLPAQAGSLFESVERGALRGLFGSAERGAVRSFERGAVRSVERGGARSVERGTARSLGRESGQAIDRKALRQLERSHIQNLTRRDLLNHERAHVKPVTNPREAFRFTTREKSLSDLRNGIAPEHHMTATAGRGRPLSAESAMRRFGLLRKPEARETIVIPRGQPIRVNKAVGGAAGVGEITSTQRLSPDAIKKVIPIH